MKLLLENWRRFLKEEDQKEYDYEAEVAKEKEELEQKHFGASANIGQMLYDIYQQEMVTLEAQGYTFKQIIDNHHREIFNVIQTKFNNISSNKVSSNSLENSGRGSFRAVFSCDKDFVIKIDASVDGSGTDMNRDDQKVGTNPKYKDIFPRVFKVDPEYKWIVAEKVKPIRHKLTICDAFPNRHLNNDLSNTDKYVELIKICMIYKVAQMKGAKNTMVECENKFFTLRTVLHIGRAAKLDTFMDIIKEFNKLPLFFKMVSAVFELDVDVEEIMTVRNLGTGTDDRLVILDSSIADSLDKGLQAL